MVVLEHDVVRLLEADVELGVRVVLHVLEREVRECEAAVNT